MATEFASFYRRLKERGDTEKWTMPKMKNTDRQETSSLERAEKIGNGGVATKFSGRKLTICAKSKNEKARYAVYAKRGKRKIPKIVEAERGPKKQ